MSSPIIVGGIGDSGTRGVRQLLTLLDVFMLDDDDTNKAGDSKTFTQQVKFIVPLVKRIFREFHSADFNVNHTTEWGRFGTQIALDIVEQVKQKHKVSTCQTPVRI